jgi:hypothetical protein
VGGISVFIVDGFIGRSGMVLGGFRRAGGVESRGSRFECRTVRMAIKTNLFWRGNWSHGERLLGVVDWIVFAVTQYLDVEWEYNCVVVVVVVVVQSRNVGYGGSTLEHMTMTIQLVGLFS